MGFSINRPLIPHKILFFTFYGALGCILAFLTPHMRTLGLGLAEITWIISFLPISSLAGPPLVGLLADRLGNYRVITIVFMVLTAVMHTSLLFLPPYEVTPPMEPRLAFKCDSFGAALVLEPCGQACPKATPSQSSSFRIWGCQHVCFSTDAERNSSDFEIAAQPTADPAHLVLRSLGGYKDYKIFHDNKTYLEFSRTVVVSQLRGEGEEARCHYPQEEFMMNESHYSGLTCRTRDSSCEVICNAAETVNGIRLLQEPVCQTVKGNPALTFWLYFAVRALADMCNCILLSLLEAVAVTMVQQHKGDYGREKMGGVVSVGIFSPLCGYLVDTHIGTHYNYAPVFYVFDGLLVIAAIMVMFLPIKVEVPRKSLWKDIGSLIKTPELNVLLLLMTLLGMFWGHLKAFIYVYLEDLEGSKLLMGLTVTIGILPSLLLMYKSNAVVQFCGHHYLLMLAFVSYCFRFAGMAYIENPWWALLLESLEVFSFSLMNVSAATLAYKIAPKTFVATAQALVYVSHFNIGRCIGTSVGGYLSTQYGYVFAFQCIAVVSAISAAIYLGVYELLKHLKARKTPFPKPHSVTENGNVPSEHEPLQPDDGKC